ncbi:MAG: hypothetical protein ACLVJO_01345 [[Clostridium] scindens]
MSDAIVKVENLRKTFREEEVLKGITCEFSRGKTHAVIRIMARKERVL